MFDHRYLSEMSKALHIFLDFSFLSCAVITFIRVAGAAQTAQATANPPRVQSHDQPRFQGQTGA
ncbi:MAG TPA: hypothetical protein VME23_00635 [Terracidiphilus sp.]|nr:hypothetical protein [Terracidiphilus sp.]